MVLASFLETVKRAFAAELKALETTLKDLDLDVDLDFFVFDEQPLVLVVRGSAFLKDEVWRSLNELVMQEFKGQYSPIQRGWIIPKPIAKTEEPTRTGLPTIDEKLEKIEAEKLIAGEILLVELDRIQPNKYNPNEMSGEEFNALVENMKQEGPHGTDPLLVRPLGKGFELIDGEHRHRSAKLLGWKKVRVIVREVDEHRAMEINYAKNRLRGHINSFKEAELFYSTWNRLGTQEAVAKKFGVSRQYVTETVALRRIPEEIQQKIATRVANRSLLEVLARIEDPADQEKLAEKIGQGITVREAQDFANSLKTAVGREVEDKGLGELLPKDIAAIDKLKERGLLTEEQALDVSAFLEENPDDDLTTAIMVKRGLNPEEFAIVEAAESKEPVTRKKKPKKGKAKFHCDFCGPRLEYQVHEVPGRGWVCNNCGRNVEVREGEEKAAPKPVEKPKKKEVEVPPEPFPERMRVSVSRAERDVYQDLLVAYDDGRLKAMPFLNDDRQYYYIVRATYPDIGFAGVEAPVYLDNEEVHEGREDWDDAVIKALERQGADPMRIPYEGTLGLAKRGEIVEQIIGKVNTLISEAT